ncbi:MAG: ATP-binding protein [Thermoproteus sp.]
MYLDAPSPEYFVQSVVDLAMKYGEVGLDTINYEVLVRPYDKRRVCRGRPTLPHFVYYDNKRVLRGAEAAGLARGVYWFRPIGIIKRGDRWNVAASCKRKPPLTGWQIATAPVVHDLLRSHAEENFWRYWPRGESWNVSEWLHMLIVGGSATGKTTFLKSLLKGVQNWVVVDLTEKNEYAELGETCPGTISLSQFDVDELVMLYTLAVSAVTSTDQAISAVQYGVFKKHASKLAYPDKLISAIIADREVTEMTKQVLVSKLMALCAEYKEGKCVPHPAVMTPTKPCRVYHLPYNQFMQSLVANGILLDLFKRATGEETVVAVDEYHKIAPKDPAVVDPAERLIRMGRHKGLHVAIATQNPLDLKESLRGIIPTQVFFALYGQAAEYAAKVLNVPVYAIESLGVGEWLAVVRGRRKRSP